MKVGGGSRGKGHRRPGRDVQGGASLSGGGVAGGTRPLQDPSSKCLLKCCALGSLSPTQEACAESLGAGSPFCLQMHIQIMQVILARNDRPLLEGPVPHLSLLAGHPAPSPGFPLLALSTQAASQSRSLCISVCIKNPTSPPPNTHTLWVPHLWTFKGPRSSFLPL